MNKQRLLQRFLQYVKIDTTAVDESGNYPSSPGQMEIGKLLTPVSYTHLTLPTNREV